MLRYIPLVVTYFKKPFLHFFFKFHLKVTSNTRLQRHTHIIHSGPLSILYQVIHLLYLLDVPRSNMEDGSSYTHPQD